MNSLACYSRCQSTQEDRNSGLCCILHADCSLKDMAELDRKPVPGSLAHNGMFRRYRFHGLSTLQPRGIVLVLVPDNERLSIQEDIYNRPAQSYVHSLRKYFPPKSSNFHHSTLLHINKFPCLCTCHDLNTCQDRRHIQFQYIGNFQIRRLILSHKSADRHFPQNSLLQAFPDHRSICLDGSVPDLSSFEDRLEE